MVYVDCIVCSPPYAESLHLNEPPEVQLARLESKGNKSAIAKASRGGKFVSDSNAGYGATPGNLGNLSAGEAPESDMNDTIEPVEWISCYDDNWKGIISEASFAHPAKMARGLVARIFDHLFATGRIRCGSLVVDPFGGIGTTAIEGASRGCKVVCCELELKFFELMKGNFELHRKTWEAFSDPLPVAVNGDSRNLVALLGPVLAECCVSSPPYAESRVESELQRQAKITDVRIQEVIAGYGTTPGQLGALVAGSVEAVLSSPPYEGSVGTPSCGRLQAESGGTCSIKAQVELGITADYGLTEGQLGHTEGDTFWQAARVIISQSFAILRPGGCAAWVVKAFVRNKAIVDFPGDWMRLCSACGFQTVEVIHASLVKRTAEASLFGGEEVKEVKRVSFFRRLAEKKGSPKINHEVVLIMEKPS